MEEIIKIVEKIINALNWKKLYVGIVVTVIGALMFLYPLTQPYAMYVLVVGTHLMGIGGFDKLRKLAAGEVKSK